MPVGTFQLGRLCGADVPVTLPARDLTTHAVVLGMTGSGKTGLSIALLEEAARAGVPVLAIDPKGDLGNLALAFPDLDAASFLPWVDPEEARRAGKPVGTHAEDVASAWREGLAGWGMCTADVRSLVAAREVRVFTPGSRAGHPLAMLRSLAPPANADEDTLRDAVVSATSSLLCLVGVDGDALQDREHVLVSRLLHGAWGRGHAVDLPWLIAALQRPPFDRIGVLPLDDFFPPRDRAALAMRLNNLLAAPGTAAWMEGEALDVASLLRTPDGRPRACVVSIAHLGDAERMFVVTALLDALVAWMRAQPGTSSLRALLFMDEVAGYLPPVAVPPSKAPMLTLLKQARAFGLGVVLATQNPVDLDYKALSNCGTWFLGRLQTARDRARVLDGLEGAATAAFDRSALDRALAGLAPRHFVLHSVHAEAPLVFQSRWTMSYLRGPVTRDEIKRLKAWASTPATASGPVEAGVGPAIRPALPVGTRERFRGRGARKPLVYVQARLHHVERRGLDVWREVAFEVPLLEDDRRVDWDSRMQVDPAAWSGDAPEGVAWEQPPAWLRTEGAREIQKRFVAWAQEGLRLRLLRSPTTGLWSSPDETVDSFRSRVAAASGPARDVAVAAVQAHHAGRIAAAAEKVGKAEARLLRERAEASTAQVDTVAMWGGALLGAMFGRGSALSKITSAARTTNRNLARHGDVTAARAALDAARASLAALTAACEDEVARCAFGFEAEGLVVDTIQVAPRKADTVVLGIGIVWVGSG